jgi:hypothetical protein
MIDIAKWIKYLKTLTIVAGVFLLLAVVVYFSFRNSLLHYAFDKAQYKLNSKYTLQLHAHEISFSGLRTISVQQLSAVPAQCDTLLLIQSADVSVELLPLLLGKVNLSKLNVSSGYIQWIKNQTQNNLAFINPQSTNDSIASTVDEKKEAPAGNYGKRIYKLLDLVFDAAPDDITAAQFNIILNESEANAHIRINHLTLNGSSLNAEISSFEQDTIHTWRIAGTLDLGDKQMNITATGNPIADLPYIRSKINLQTGFGLANFTLNKLDIDDGELVVEGRSSIQQLRIHHPKIATKDVLLPNAAFDFRGVVGKDFFMLDSASQVQVEQLKFNPFFMLETGEDTILRLSVAIPRMPAQQFVDALPEGLFNHIRGMEVKGEFEYRMDLVYNENKPNDLIFESAFRKYNLSIVKYGDANLGKLNEEFVHVPLERGKPVRSIVVGTSNPYYTPLENISPYLRACVLTTEDPSFFYHRGFIDEAFKQSIIKNLRTRKFARGASTISMQLVKNVFLTREKTLSRKLEEILLVYIIENNRIATKERMLEVYFNIIEWGPNVYGIGEAAEFYFNKKPSQLTLSECMFLATIIPRPKGFMWRFDKQGIQKEFVGRHYKFLTELMVRRSVIAPEDTVNFNYQIPITGRAKSFIKVTPDSTYQDLQFDEYGILRQSESDD